MTIDKHVTTYILPLIEYDKGKKLKNNQINIITMNELIQILHFKCFKDKDPNPIVTGFVFEVGYWDGRREIITVTI